MKGSKKKGGCGKGDDYLGDVMMEVVDGNEKVRKRWRVEGRWGEKVGEVEVEMCGMECYSELSVEVG